MTETLSAFVGMLGGLVVGVALAYMAYGHGSPYGRWLGRTCWVRPCGRPNWVAHTIVAVSWRGAVCVRRADRMEDDGYWIKKENVLWRVRWDRPKEEEE
jgi:hypothetical protein